MARASAGKRAAAAESGERRRSGLAPVAGGKSGPGPSSMSLDRLIHERVRLAIVSALAVNPALSFNELKQLLGTTDGNLSVHARRLEEAGYVECLKTFAGRVPRTEFRLTPAGRTALEQYLAHMEAVIKATRSRS